MTTPLTSESQFIQAGSFAPAPDSAYLIPADDEDDLDDDDIPGFSHPGFATTPTSATTKGKTRASEQLAEPSGSVPRTPLSGNIGTATGPPKPTRSTVGGLRVERRYTGGDTLDEPISTTIGRDLYSIYTKLVQVLYPPRSGSSREVLKDWDLWGPLVLCLLLGILLSINAPPSQSLNVFTSVVVIIAMGSLVVTVQAKLLGGRVSFFQGLCALGYCVAPLNIAALVSTFVHLIYVRAPVALAAWAWCIWASVNFLDGTKIEQQRILLAVYPLLLFYFILAWMIIIQ